ncbi:MAG TPA: 2-phospho-L-lactate guanylyltransferase [Terriglobales bacterium]|nr:2-phospho-L-lactate guanylyltransferase [Terriglobales bacterium]
MILLPVKSLSQAKQRLASVLSQPARTELAQAMLLDVFEALGKWVHRPAVSIVTGDAFALEWAHHFCFDIIVDSAHRSETEAIERATRICEARGVDNTLVIPGDIPLVQPWELEKVLEAAPREGTVLVPSADGRGTNAAFREPPGLFPLRFGNDSFQPHLAAARATGKPCVVLSLAGLALDVDTPTDLRQLAEAPGETRSQRLARQLNLADLSAAANQ